MRTRGLWTAATLLAASVSVLDAAQPPAPALVPLPRLELDSLPAAVQQDLQRAYDEARTSPDDGAAAGRLAMALHAQEQYQSADAVYRRARQLEPKSFTWAYLSGVVEARLGQFAAAAASFRRALATDPAYVPARVALADALLQDGQLDACRAEYAALARDYPELPVAHYGYGRVLAILGDATTSLAHFQKAVDLVPEFGAAHYALGLAYRDAGLTDRAGTHLEAYGRLGARRPVPPDPLMDRVHAFRSTARHLLAEGARLEREGRLDESIAVHLKAIEADRQAAAQAHVNLISLYGRKDQLANAEGHYRAALRLQGDHADAHYNWGVLLASKGRQREAADAFRRALQINPFHSQAHNNLATLLAGGGQLEEAAVHYRQTIANDPSHRSARFNLGRVLLTLGRPREAAEQFEWLLVPEGSETPRVGYALATAWLAAGEIATARKYGEDALRAARRLGQTDLAARIEHDLQRMKQP